MSFPAPMDIECQSAPKISFDESWELHKPKLARLYLQENLELSKIYDIMLADHNFRAADHQYKYRFRQWGWKRSLAAAKKARILDIGAKRAARGKATAIKRQARNTDSKQLLRYARETKADVRLFSGPATIQLPEFMSESLLAQNIGFAGWNMPHQHILQQLAFPSNHERYFGQVATPPNDSDICTPPGQDAMSPRVTQAISIRAANANAERLLSGDFSSLMKCLQETQLRSLAEWMNQYWYLCYMTAKNWGSHPNTWTSISLAPYNRLLESAAPSPGDTFTDEPATTSSASCTRAELAALVQGAMKNKLCKWTIHVRSDTWDYLPDPVTSADQDVTREDIQHPTYEDRLHEAMKSNDFSTVPEEDLPLSLKRMSEIVAKSPTQVFQESIKFAIISRNIDLLNEMLARKDVRQHDIDTIFPLHLALTYLDGSRSCCMIFRILSRRMDDLKLNFLSLGPSGLSLFDCLMVHILRNHSSMSPGAAIGDLAGVTSFGGEEIDVCGRWDPASSEYRYLKQQGLHIPTSWRHKFCHTSVQMVCHCLQILGANSDFNSGSLFRRRCFTCGLNMSPSPMHVLVLTAWHVAKYGSRKEDLLGMICVLLSAAVSMAPYRRHHSDVDLFCPVVLDAATFATAPFTVTDVCAHEALWPSDMAKQLANLEDWSIPWQMAKGWSIFCRVLEQIEGQHRWASTGLAPIDASSIEFCQPERSDASEEEYSDSDDLTHKNKIFFEELPSRMQHLSPTSCACTHLEEDDVGRSFGLNTALGHLWAAFQVELLTYRRTHRDSTWTSEHLTISIIEHFLDTLDPNVLPAVSSGKLKQYCVCGRFDGEGGGSAPPRQVDVCDSHSGVLDDGNLAAYIDDCMLYEY